MNPLFDVSIAMYVALIVALAVWFGIFFYLWRLDAQARQLRHRIETLPEQEIAPTSVATLRNVRTTSDVSRQPETDDLEESTSIH